VHYKLISRSGSSGGVSYGRREDHGRPMAWMVIMHAKIVKKTSPELFLYLFELSRTLNDASLGDSLGLN
jgi:hypothetical protein